jgi:hypothetical protein
MTGPRIARVNKEEKLISSAPHRAAGSGRRGDLITVGSRARSARSHSTIAAMAYDEELADRIRELVAGESALTEQKMFGGLAFLIGGNMAITASGQGGLLVHVDPEQSDKLVATTSARLMEMRGRRMRGWLRVDTDDVRTKRQLAKWVGLGATYARSLPRKR